MIVNKIPVFIFMILCFLTSLQSALIDNLVSYWQFDDAGTIAYDSAPSHLYPGTLKPSESLPTWTTDKKTGTGALYFDGTDDYVEIAMPQQMKTLGELTISMWFKWEPGNVGTHQDLLSSTYSSNNQFWWRIKSDGTEYSMYTNNGNATLLSSVVPTSNAWHHTVFLYKDATKESKIYLDGNLVASSNSIEFPDSTNALFAIGRYIASGTNYFHGTIDEVGIWNRALSTDTNSEVLQLYNLGLAGQELPVPEPVNILLIFSGLLLTFFKIKR